ncbi:uncharacterized protein LOC144142071 isoform X2 [Haemaphysalis longicornis]
MNSTVQISLLATLFALCYAKGNLFGCHRKASIQEFMTAGSRIWFYATSRSSGQTTCIRDNVHNATAKGIAFLRTYVNRTVYEQDFYVIQMYGFSLNTTTMLVRKMSGVQQNISEERMIYTNQKRTCAVFYVKSLKGQHECTKSSVCQCIRKDP